MFAWAARNTVFGWVLARLREPGLRSSLAVVLFVLVLLFVFVLLSVPATAGVLQRDVMWPAGVELRVCFFPEVPDESRRRIAEIGQRWNQPGIMGFDFGSDTFATCDGTQAYEIRVGIVPGGSSWSYVGTMALNIPQLEPTLRVGEDLLRSGIELPREEGDPLRSDGVLPQSFLEGTLLHEFGHTLGFLHEAVNPNMECLSSMDAASRDQFLDQFGESSFYWSRDMAARQFPMITDLENYVVSEYDPESVMHYLAADSFWGTAPLAPAGCFPETRPMRLSELDVVTLRTAYGGVRGSLPTVSLPAIRTVFLREAVLFSETLLPLDTFARRSPVGDPQGHYRLVAELTSEWLEALDRGSLDPSLLPLFERLRAGLEVEVPPLVVSTDPDDYLLRAAAFLAASEGTVPASWRRTLQAAVDLEEPFAQFLVGASYELGIGGPQSTIRASSFYQRAAASGSVMAALRQGDWATGTGQPADFVPDYPSALEWYERAAEKGSQEAKYGLAVLYDQGLGGVVQDLPTAAAAAREAAESRIPRAQLLYGLLLTDGLGVPRDLDEAMRWFERAAGGRSADAAMVIGSLKEGLIAGLQGVPQDYQAALDAYLVAATLGHRTAPLRIAALYEGIPGRLEADLEKARQWYEIAAGKGHAEALLRLGEFFLEEGASRDPMQALVWLELAVLYTRGEARENAMRLRSQVSGALDPLEWAQVHRDAASWVSAFEQGRSTLELLSSGARSSPVSAPPRMRRQRSGSGVFVTPRHVLTNDHVIRGCDSLWGRINGDSFRLEPYGPSAAANDLAVLQASKLRDGQEYARLAPEDIQVGQLIGVAGFPQPEDHGEAFDYRSSEVTGRSGIDSDYSKLRFKDPVSRGYSGGPILDRSARLIGLVLARNRDAEIYYGIKGWLLRQILEDRDVDLRVQNEESPVGDADTWGTVLQERAKAFTVFVECLVERESF